MEHGILFLIIIILFFVLLFSGQYISTILFAVGIMGVYAIGGMGLLQGFLINNPYTSVASYSLTTIPLYVIMAQFIMQSGIVGDIYTIVFKAAKGRKGILGVLTILLGGFLGAVSGSGSATAAALARLSDPELRARGYTPVLSGAIAASAGSLSSIIPPSIMLIIYGVQAQVSIGTLFIGAMIPGILTMAAFMLVNMVLLRTKAEREQTGDISLSQLDTVPIGRAVFSVCSFVLIIIIIFGGIYSGFVTPTEAGALGALVSFIVALVTKSVNLNFIKSSFLETSKVTVMCLTVMIGGSIFGKFITLSGFSRSLEGLLSPLMARPSLLLVIIAVFYFVMFMFLDGTSTYILTLPILLPIIQAIGVDVVWFGVFISMICTLGCLSPPVGFSVYAVSSIVGDVPISKLFKYAMYFAITAFVIVGLLMILFPAVVTWLPSTMQ